MIREKDLNINTNKEAKEKFEVGLVLGSTSVHKIDAVKEACAKIGIKVEIKGVSAKSEINEQPYGLEETYRGALNRAKNSQKENNKMFAMGIESGIIPIDDKFIDLAVVIVLTPDGKSFMGTSAGIEFPKYAIEEARLRGFETTTAGSIVAEKLGGSETDPHSTLTNGKISRKELLVDAIVSVLSEVLTN